MKNSLRITVLYCNNCVKKDVDIHSVIKNKNGLSIKTINLPCSSKIQAGNILSILDKDADGVELVACSEESCRFLVGSRRAENRINYIHSLLKKINVNTGCLGLTRKAGLDNDDLAELAEARADALKKSLIKKGE